jgi:hypothetical protein
MMEVVNELCITTGLIMVHDDYILQYVMTNAGLINLIQKHTLTNILNQ